jgi:paraquat-inducible protein A
MEPLPVGMMATCSRCGSMMEKRTQGSLHMTAAFSLAALILYFPANLFPILHMEVYGVATDNTAWSGMQTLFQEGDYPIGAIVFLASILIPFLKLVGLLFLVLAVKFRRPGGRQGKLQRVWMYRVIDVVGRWAMLDVFVVAILVSLVKLEKLATVIAGPGLLAFGGVVVLTILASQSFDPQSVWNDQEESS